MKHPQHKRTAPPRALLVPAHYEARALLAMSATVEAAPVEEVVS